MDPGNFHFSKCGNTTREFSFQCSLEVDRFLEISQAEVGTVKNFESDLPRRRKAFARQLDPSLGKLVAGDPNGSAVIRKLIIDRHRLQPFDNTLGIGGLQLRI